MIQKWAQPARARPPDRDRPSRRGRRPGADAGVAQPPVPPQPHRPALELGRQRQPGGRARATCRPTRSRWRSPTARSPTAAASSRRTSACASRTTRAASCSRSSRGARRRLEHLRRDARRRSCRACARRRTTPGGTSTPVFDGFPITVAGKTGTAERGAQGDQSWYVVAAPYDDPRVVVAVTIERGGFGAEAAAPAARRILAATSGSRARRRSARPGRLRTDGRRRAATPFGTGVQRFREPRARLLRLDFLLLLGDARPDRLQPRDARHRDRDRRPRRRRTTSSPARPCTRSSA